MGLAGVVVECISLLAGLIVLGLGFESLSPTVFLLMLFLSVSESVSKVSLFSYLREGGFKGFPLLYLEEYYL